MTQSVKPLPFFICENETNTNYMSDMKTNQSKIKESINVTFSKGKIETKTQKRKISLSKQLENLNVKRNSLLIPIRTNRFQN